MKVRASKVPSAKGRSSARPGPGRRAGRWRLRSRLARAASSICGVTSTPVTCAGVRAASCRATPPGPVATSSTRAAGPGEPGSCVQAEARPARAGHSGHHGASPTAVLAKRQHLGQAVVPGREAIEQLAGKAVRARFLHVVLLVGQEGYGGGRRASLRPRCRQPGQRRGPGSRTGIEDRQSGPLWRPRLGSLVKAGRTLRLLDPFWSAFGRVRRRVERQRGRVGIAGQLPGTAGRRLVARERQCHQYGLARVQQPRVGVGVPPRAQRTGPDGSPPGPLRHGWGRRRRRAPPGHAGVGFRPCRPLAYRGGLARRSVAAPPGPAGVPAAPAVEGGAMARAFSRWPSTAVTSAPPPGSCSWPCLLVTTVEPLAARHGVA